MSRTRLSFAAGIVGIAAIAAIIIAVSGGSSNAKPNVAPSSAISVKQTSLGKTLVDANGRSLYLFAGDTRDLSRLSRAGQAVWPRFTATTKPRALSGAVASQISTITKVNGTAQIAYNGHPLYYYVGDQKPGQTAGQGLNQFGARWYVLTPGGAAITSAPSAPAQSAPSNGGSSYSY
jgi:predicted lipoprotein with Yx(FWY)xxD motif